jgi:hypothetical protein
MTPCDICLEDTCKGKHDCDCINCKTKEKCYRYLSPTIRITTKCTQSCSHCCFSCSPDNNIFMSTETASKIKMFLINNNINKRINIMGGEFFCNPDWREIIDIMVHDIDIVRLVTNGDWDENIISQLSKYKNLYLAISYDQWHNNENFNRAIKLCNDYNIKYVSGEGTLDSKGIVPIGRSSFSSQSCYSFFNCYCQNPTKMYTFLIDEIGDIFKCSFGVWNYDNINEYLNGGFSKRFKEFNTKFYDVFISNCEKCQSIYKRQNL